MLRREREAEGAQAAMGRYKRYLRRRVDGGFATTATARDGARAR